MFVLPTFVCTSSSPVQVHVLGIHWRPFLSAWLCF